MLPTIIPESSIRYFCFYFEGELCDGACYQNRLYRLVTTLEVGDRTGVREVCEQLHQRQQPCIITTSRRHYKVWADICSSALARSLVTAPFDYSEAE
ncbi:MAG: hypothetical protein AAFX78_01595 [Cyanobacteria bacterium J06638_20]